MQASSSRSTQLHLGRLKEAEKNGRGRRGRRRRSDGGPRGLSSGCDHCHGVMLSAICGTRDVFELRSIRFNTPRAVNATDTLEWRKLEVRYG